MIRFGDLLLKTEDSEKKYGGMALEGHNDRVRKIDRVKRLGGYTEIFSEVVRLIWNEGMLEISKRCPRNRSFSGISSFILSFLVIVFCLR